MLEEDQTPDLENAKPENVTVREQQIRMQERRNTTDNGVSNARPQTSAFDVTRSNKIRCFGSSIPRWINVLIAGNEVTQSVSVIKLVSLSQHSFISNVRKFCDCWGDMRACLVLYLRTLNPAI